MKRTNNVETNGSSQDKRRRLRLVSFRGIRGNFTEAAAIQHFETKSKEEINTKECVTFEEVFENVKNGCTDFGIVPIENSISGTLHNVYDELLNSSLYVVGECSRLEEHCLCVLPGTKIGSVKNILSHPAMFSQCSEFIKTLETNSEQKEIGHQSCWDTSAACKRISDGSLNDVAAICPRSAAEANNLVVLKSSIGNDENNETRYLLIASKPASKPEFVPYDRSTRMKTSIAVALANVPNALYRMVSCFGLRNINILKMESRPAVTAGSHTVFKKESSSSEESAVVSEEQQTPKKRPVPIIKHWDYIFYIDYEPDMEKDVNRNLMNSLEEFTLGVRNFGTYKQNLPDVITVNSPWKGLADISAM